MSLVNQVLKDLARRSKQPISQEIALLTLESPATALISIKELKHFFAKRNIFILLLSLTLFSLIVLSIHNHKIHAKLSQPIQFIPQTNHQTSNSNDENSSLYNYVRPSLLTAVTVQTIKNLTLFNFQLTDSALYRVSINHKLHKLTLILENTHFSASLPQVDYPGSPLTSLKIINQNDGTVKMIFSLLPEIEVTRLELNQVNKRSELQLGLIYPEKKAVTNQSIVKQAIPENQSNILFQQALNDAANGQTKQAINELQAIIKEDPDYLKAYETLVPIFLQEREVTQAKALLSKGLEFSPNHLPFIILKARLLLMENNYLRAFLLLKKINPSIKDVPDYYSLLAAIYQHEGNYNMAANLYKKLANINPSQPKWWIGLGVALESLGKTYAAKDAYENADKNSDKLSPNLQSYLMERLQNDAA